MLLIDNTYDFHVMKFDSRTYKISEIDKWYRNRGLTLSPKFQRRDVWSIDAKSYFLDTIIKDIPSHKIFLRDKIVNSITVREVVDGQQRLRSILDFMNDKIVIRTIHNNEYGNIKFSELPEFVQRDFLNYKLAIDVLYDATDTEVLDLFARLNTHTVKLNKQELRNARYHGNFKQTVYSLGQKSIGFFLNNKIFTIKRIMRMYEVELISELLIAMKSGLQDKKKIIDDYYKLYDEEEFEDSEKLIKQYWSILNILEESYKNTIINTKFSNKAPFYSLFLVIYDIEFGLPGQKGSYKIRKQYSESVDNLYALSNQLKVDEPDIKYTDFVKASSSQTDNIRPRQIRHDTILNELLDVLR